MVDETIRSVEAGWQHSVLVCAHERSPDQSRASCGAERGSRLRQWLKDRIRTDGLRGEIIAVKTGCLGVCSRFGGTVAVQPYAKPRALMVVASDDDRESLWEKVLRIIG